MSNRPFLLGTVLAAFLGCTAGGSSGLAPPTPGKPDSAGRPFSIVTYNAGLVNVVGLAEERKPYILEALADEDADVVCLEEVWTDADARKLIEGLAAVYPHSFRKRTTDYSFGLLECNLFSMLSLKSCVDEECTAIGMSTFECVDEGGPCVDKYEPLSLGCKHCLAANSESPVACAFLGAKKFTAGGRNGLLLLSKWPIENAKYIAYDTAVVKRGLISADVAGQHIQCTHMTAQLSIVPYRATNRFESWAEEHLAQVDVIDANAPEGQCSILMGDLNAGPSGNDIDGELEDNYNELLARGYEETWLEPTCTYCSENPLVGDGHSTWIDHVMTRNCPPATNVYRVIDEPIEVTFEQDIETRPSDHYGLRAEF